MMHILNIPLIVRLLVDKTFIGSSFGLLFYRECEQTQKLNSDRRFLANEKNGDDIGLLLLIVSSRGNVLRFEKRLEKWRIV